MTSASQARRIALLSTSDTDLLSARASRAAFNLGNPVRQDLSPVISGSDIVVLRVLGSSAEIEPQLNELRASRLPLVVLGGERQPSAELMECSTLPIGVAAQAHAYLVEGGPVNLAQLHAFLCDTVLLTGEGFDEPVAIPEWGYGKRPGGAAALEDVSDSARDKVRVGVLYYRAHEISGNAGFAHALVEAIDATGAGVGVPIFASSLRSAPQEVYDALGSLDALVVSVLAAGGSKPSGVSAGGEDGSWDIERIAALNIPTLQGLCLTSSRAEWVAGTDGVTPLDSATQIAIPEFDGRIITAPFSFKEIDADGLPHYVADPERCARVAGIAVKHAVLRHVPNKDKKLALVLSAYPTKHSRVGNAVGLDTPVSTVRLLRRLAEAGYDIGDGFGVLDIEDETEAGDRLIHTLIAAGGQDEQWLTSAQLTDAQVTITAEQYGAWTADLPAALRDSMVDAWGPAPGQLFVNDAGEIVVAALRTGNIVLMIQPPRGFGENPIAIYHDPDLPPSHHYLAAYRWLEEGFGAHAVVHLGKHGSMEWLPGKNAALSAECATDAAIGNLPLIYPFLVNDPGEGAQAKRRAHATIVDHLIPPMARAESYGDIARLEQLLDEYGNIASMDPAKLPAIRGEIWNLMHAAELHRDLGLEDRPDDEEFDDFILHVDGWLCEIKDAQIRDGLHVLGGAPVGPPRVNLVLAILRASQVWGGRDQAVPGLRAALGLKEGAGTRAVDEIEGRARALIEAMEAGGWNVAAIATLHDDPNVQAVLRFAATEVVPRLAGTAEELDAVMRALAGGFIRPGPSGSPLRGLVNVLPTGRNFYTVDPRAVPSRLAWQTGQAMADSLIQRYLDDTGSYPESVGLSVWGTSAMRTSGDDIAEVLALLGVRPEWDEASRRVSRLSVISLNELGRPRIDVTVRISGFFRDAFPHVVAMLDDAVRMVAKLGETDEQNFVAAHARADLAEHGDERRATIRVFGSKPGSYGAGILQVVEAGTWRDDKDLAEVYTAWGGFAYGRGLDGVAAADDMRTNYRRIKVAAKNIDTREHDIADSDDYFQYHGGMVATVRALTGSDPKAYVGDSTTPDAVRTRTLSEETARVFRSRVVNPRWIAAMRRHGYKGAFELAATVDYLFGFDATAGVVHDWMYEKLAQEYVLDPTTREFLDTSNPWALQGIVERLQEAADRGLWADPSPETLAALRQAYLDVEGDLEDR
ncbi:cobaltochelatase subunit CobN [Candidatus Mycolicibacterium alkanivorans]|uniref:Cobaltochelatase subunit CobN n=1 Tax=Candidatus Mycolicibacterium alkanivorans TaxID=2954114 RepID=A0ABS9YXA7_9MYCO|nr:cobaltochelatase subunit CobN [Candidatus Mycolicibacterium alkanivorans]MCI4675840.1 cobaltochelatase subunit CobN [Candidatus Mycolicibacterium alkanivorans]